MWVRFPPLLPSKEFMKKPFDMFVYYYFLGRKYGYRPCDSAKWAKRFCKWWDAKEYDVDVGPPPTLQGLYKNV